MNPLFAAAVEMHQFCRERGWDFCVIGGLAVQRWGEPRFTRDVDCTVLTGFGQESTYVDTLLARFDLIVLKAFAGRDSSLSPSASIPRTDAVPVFVPVCGALSVIYRNAR